MINYTLKCANEHRFDSWFQSADAFEKLKEARMVSCAICGDSHVEKAMMAPRVRPARSTSETQQGEAPERALSTPASPAEQALAELKRHIEKNSDYVGSKFASEARAMHEGSAPERAIYGEARPEEAKALIEDGVPVAPLPFNITRKTN
ncbi:DUF1178 family protein [Shimia aestuarii]|uniref:DUF1178 family protein n=1 Tax=Shimia aestuarii TaxID=254406 RepID=A0A1I4LW53_9RHOB|nr:DUF1178 family protein [Shimia aestuarii]SFL94947.1 hypothetical protein SAMN04488042_102251 [Shimia aestuarii]